MCTLKSHHLQYISIYPKIFLWLNNLSNEAEATPPLPPISCHYHPWQLTTPLLLFALLQLCWASHKSSCHVWTLQYGTSPILSTTQKGILFSPLAVPVWQCLLPLSGRKRSNRHASPSYFLKQQQHHRRKMNKFYKILKHIHIFLVAMIIMKFTLFKFTFLV